MKRNQMIHVYIWGAGELGQQCLRQIACNVSKQLNYFFCDNSLSLIGSEVNGVPVIGLEELQKHMDNNCQYIIFVAVRQPQCDKVIMQLAESGISGHILKYEDIYNCTSELNEFLGKPNLSYLETHLNDHCNLRCRGCGHLSNIAPPKYTEFTQYESDMKRLGELFWNVNKIRLMGGEPFLNNNIYDFVALGREIFPQADIRIATNGLLIDESKVDLLEKLRGLNIALDITSYPPTQKKREKIEYILKKSGARYYFTENTKTFVRFRNANADRNISEAYSQCPINECHFLRDGKLSVCSFPILYKQLDTFMKNIFEINESDVIDLYDQSLNGWDIVFKLSTAIHACRYCCTDKIEHYDWEGFSDKTAKVEDWCVRI